MSEPIHDYGLDAAGNRVSRGRFIVDREGHLCVSPVSSPLKASQRYATQVEIDSWKPGYAPPSEPEIAPPGFFETPAIEVSDDPIDEVVESISIDAPAFDFSDRD